MSTSTKTRFGTMVAAAVIVVGGAVGYASFSQGAPVFLTRLVGVITTYPANSAFNVGSSTPQGGAAKLGVSLNVADTFTKAFEVASTTGTGTATSSAPLLLVKNTGCIQMTATSSATQVKLVLSATGATSTYSGTAYWSYGTCP